MDALTQGLQRSDIIALLLTNILAFLLFVFVLKKYAWGPLLAMLDARRERIKADFDAAAKELEDAQKLRAQFDAKMAEIRSIEREKVQEAVKRGEAIASTLEQNAREKTGQFLAKAESEIEREVRAARLDLRRQTVDLAIMAAEKIIQEELDDQKHRQLVEEFITRLGETRAE